ncbi:hypothetical protein V1477_013298 [Vespula maculifrons]|uniref:Uncharacterized protein n=1 Tax=Vespula maculifrons TaxID=7453 RepID=A0ABD2BVJ3_VESMC
MYIQSNAVTKNNSMYHQCGDYTELQNPQTNHRNCRNEHELQLETPSTKAPPTVSITSNNMSISATAHGCKLLPTAVVQLRHGKLIHNSRVLIDSSSQLHFITENGQAAEFSTVPTLMLSRQNWLRNHPFLDIIKCTDSEKPKILTRKDLFRKVVKEAEDFSQGNEMSGYFGLCFLSRITLFKDRTVILNRVPLPHSHF